MLCGPTCTPPIMCSSRTWVRSPSCMTWSMFRVHTCLLLNTWPFFLCGTRKLPHPNPQPPTPTPTPTPPRPRSPKRPEKNADRVWDLVTGAQRYQFSSPTDRPTCVAYAPPTTARGEGAPRTAGDGGGGGGDAGATTPGGGVEAAAREERHLVGGYASGAVRVFDVPSTNTLFELQQHRGAVQQVSSGCMPHARRLFGLEIWTEKEIMHVYVRMYFEVCMYMYPEFVVCDTWKLDIGTGKSPRVLVGT